MVNIFQIQNQTAFSELRDSKNRINLLLKKWMKILQSLIFVVDILKSKILTKLKQFYREGSGLSYKIPRFLGKLQDSKIFVEFLTSRF